MGKRAGLAALATALMFFVVGCGSGAAKEIDAQALADSLATEIAYDDTLEALEQDVAEMYFDMEEGVTVCLYMGSGTTAEEVAVFDAPDEDVAATQLSHVQDYLDSQREAVQDYQPEEASRIDGAVLEQKGKYVILCVSGDSDKAKEVIEEAFQ